MSKHLADDLERTMAAHAGRTAVVDAAGRSMRYAELARRSGALAGMLQAHGVGPGERVALLAPKSIEAVVALVATLRAGGACVPVDAETPARRVRMVLDDAASRVIITTSRAVAALRAEGYDAPATLVLLDEDSGGAAVLSWADAVASAPAPPGPRGTDDLAYILFTSGSTGVPKGVALTHRNVTSFVSWCRETFRPTPEERFASIAPLHFDLSMHDLYAALTSGAAVHLADGAVTAHPERLVRFVADAAPTVVYATPSVLTLMLERGGLTSAGIGSVRRVLFAGEVFPVRPLRELAAVWPDAAFYNLYGPTETNVCTFAKIRLPIPEARVDPYPIGRPCAHCDAVVLDDGGAPVEPGRQGLLHIAGPAVFPGYWGRPDLNETAFLRWSGRRWYNTGDVVFETRDDGYVFVGRRDRMVKRRGYRIELGEIERALAAAQGVGAAAVVAREAVEHGCRITAFVTPAADGTVSVLALRRACAVALPSYMTPDRFVTVDELPRTSTGKIDYRDLSARATAPQPASSEAPRTRSL